MKNELSTTDVYKSTSYLESFQHHVSHNKKHKRKLVDIGNLAQWLSLEITTITKSESVTSNTNATKSKEGIFTSFSVHNLNRQHTTHIS